MSVVFDIGYLLAAIVLWPLLIVRRLRRGPGSIALGDRLGRVPGFPRTARCIWLHGVSLGEINATRTIVDALLDCDPDLTIAISSTTATGIDRARTLYAERDRCVVFRFPLDFGFAIRRVLNSLRPAAIVLMELEVWPNLLEIAANRRIPVLIANGRVTRERSVRRFQSWWLRPLARRMFRRIAWVGAQDAIYAERFAQIGVPAERVEVAGSVKYDTAVIADRIDGQDALAAALGLDANKPTWVCGSTGPEEERLLLDIYARLRDAGEDCQLVLVPRKPERFDDVARLIEAANYACLRRSAHPDGAAPPARDAACPAVWLGDTLGELRKFYALADVVFVGRSLVPMGGSDMIEAAALGKPVIVGPHTENFADPMARLRERDAIVEVADSGDLERAMRDLLAYSDRRLELGGRAQRAVDAERGATTRIAAAIAHFAGLPEQSSLQPVATSGIKQA